MHNLSTVFWFEVIRTMKKKTFWIMSLSFPLMIAAVFGIIIASNVATEDALEKITEESFSIAITDEATVINKDLATQLKVTYIDSKKEGIDMVRSESIDAYFYYPDNIAEQPVEVYAKEEGLFNNSKYGVVAEQLLQQSVVTSVSEQEASVLRGNVSFDQTMYQQGEEYDGIKQLIAPGIFLVLFYLLIAFFGNQMLTSTTEEKENRVIEMIMTAVEARTLIIGKILSLVVLGFLQGLIVIVPVLIGY